MENQTLDSPAKGTRSKSIGGGKQMVQLKLDGKVVESDKKTGNKLTKSVSTDNIKPNSKQIKESKGKQQRVSSIGSGTKQTQNQSHRHGPVSSTPKHDKSVRGVNACVNTSYKGNLCDLNTTDNNLDKDPSCVLQFENSVEVESTYDNNLTGSEDNTFMTAHPDNTSNTQMSISMANTTESRTDMGKGVEANKQSMETNSNMISKNATNGDILEAILGLQTTMNRVETDLQAIKKQEEDTKAEVETLKKELAKDQEAAKKQETKVTLMETSNTTLRANFEALEARMEQMEIRSEKMLNLFHYQEQILTECRVNIEKLETQKTKNNLIIQGLEVKAGETTIKAVQDFFKEQMNMQQPVQIQKAFKSEKFDNITVKLTNPGDKKTVFEHVKNLKGKKNKAGKFYSVDNQNNSRMKENRRRNKEIIKLNKNLSVAQKLELSIKKGVMMQTTVEDSETVEKPYRGNIQRPNHIDAMMLTQSEIADLEQEFPLIPGQRVPIETSTFRGYVVDVNDFEQVNRAYMLMRYKHLDARHIVCAAALHDHGNLMTEGFEDDEEFGCGRILLEYLQDTSTMNRAVFVVRYTDGKHIGIKRHDGYLYAARHAMNAKPLNQILNKYQFSWHTFVKHGRGGKKLGAGRQARYDRCENLFPEGETDSQDEEGK